MTNECLSTGNLPSSLVTRDESTTNHGETLTEHKGTGFMKGLKFRNHFIT
jgi:hypothetical protein